jgi:hypothetical protein
MIIKLCNLFYVYIYNPDVVVSTESWFSEEISNAEDFRDDYITLRRDRCSRGDTVFICVKNYIYCRELWTDEAFEMIAVEAETQNLLGNW